MFLFLGNLNLNIVAEITVTKIESSLFLFYSIALHSHQTTSKLTYLITFPPNDNGFSLDPNTCIPKGFNLKSKKQCFFYLNFFESFVKLKTLTN